MGPIWALIIAVVDGLIHYHVDWIKMNYGENDMSNPQFWNHLGLDQLAHSLAYVFIAGFVLRSL
jgi:hypothetical protein